jgi:hypothetical protein
MIKKGYLDQPRVWVDFKGDEIFVVDADEVMLELRTVRGLRGIYFGDVFALEVLESYMEKDVNKIQNLAVAGHWSMQPPRRPRSRADGALKEGLTLTLQAFKSLKRLKVYHSDSGKSPEGLLVAGDPNELMEEILEVLGREKVRCEDWTQDLPKVEISKELLYFWQDGEEARLELRSSREWHGSGVFDSPHYMYLPFLDRMEI